MAERLGISAFSCLFCLILFAAVWSGTILGRGVSAFAADQSVGASVRFVSSAAYGLPPGEFSVPYSLAWWTRQCCLQAEVIGRMASRFCGRPAVSKAINLGACEGAFFRKQDE
jgi:hypothetical protein